MVKIQAPPPRQLATVEELQDFSRFIFTRFGDLGTAFLKFDTSQNHALSMAEFRLALQEARYLGMRGGTNWDGGEKLFDTLTADCEDPERLEYTEFSKLKDVAGNFKDPEPEDLTQRDDSDLALTKQLTARQRWGVFGMFALCTLVGLVLMLITLVGMSEYNKLVHGVCAIRDFSPESTCSSSADPNKPDASPCIFVVGFTGEDGSSLRADTWRMDFDLDYENSVRGGITPFKPAHDAFACCPASELNCCSFIDPILRVFCDDWAGIVDGCTATGSWPCRYTQSNGTSILDLQAGEDRSIFGTLIAGFVMLGIAGLVYLWYYLWLDYFAGVGLALGKKFLYRYILRKKLPGQGKEGGEDLEDGPSEEASEEPESAKPEVEPKRKDGDGPVPQLMASAGLPRPDGIVLPTAFRPPVMKKFQGEPVEINVGQGRDLQKERMKILQAKIPEFVPEDNDVLSRTFRATHPRKKPMHSVHIAKRSAARVTNLRGTSRIGEFGTMAFREKDTPARRGRVEKYVPSSMGIAARGFTDRPLEENADYGLKMRWAQHLKRPDSEWNTPVEIHLRGYLDWTSQCGSARPGSLRLPGTQGASVPGAGD
mmetsp:Transcript_24208/g.55271  ORF Transcript_24208/g.55271 Transcript_24208/m.55271 type:complete len:597 (-) Transcript_24208:36-1826(-)